MLSVFFYIKHTLKKTKLCFILYWVWKIRKIRIMSQGNLEQKHHNETLNIAHTGELLRCINLDLTGMTLLHSAGRLQQWLLSNYCCSIMTHFWRVLELHLSFKHLLGNTIKICSSSKPKALWNLYETFQGWVFTQHS